MYTKVSKFSVRIGFFLCRLCLSLLFVSMLLWSCFASACESRCLTVVKLANGVCVSVCVETKQQSKINAETKKIAIDRIRSNLDWMHLNACSAASSLTRGFYFCFIHFEHSSAFGCLIAVLFQWAKKVAAVAVVLFALTCLAGWFNFHWTFFSSSAYKY